jgi:hypothetical protein
MSNTYNRIKELTNNLANRKLKFIELQSFLWYKGIYINYNTLKKYYYEMLKDCRDIPDIYD